MRRNQPTAFTSIPSLPLRACVRSKSVSPRHAPHNQVTARAGARRSHDPRQPTQEPAREPAPSSPETDVRVGTVLSKDEVLSRTRNNRTARLRRTAKLSELDVTEGDPDEQDADIWLVIKRLRSDYWLRGRVVARVKRTCDRCTKEYVDVSDGRFEVLLRGDVEEDNDESADAEGGFEAVEQFGRGVVEVDLKGHVRDGVYLGMETRALCEEGCVGVGQGKIQEEGKGWGRVMGEQEDVAEALMEMKRRLERQGL